MDWARGQASASGGDAQGWGSGLRAQGSQAQVAAAEGIMLLGLGDEGGRGWSRALVASGGFGRRWARARGALVELE
eukprot:6659340-Prymnesium_polylepis.1